MSLNSFNFFCFFYIFYDLTLQKYNFFLKKSRNCEILFEINAAAFKGLNAINGFNGFNGSGTSIGKNLVNLVNPVKNQSCLISDSHSPISCFT